MPKPKSKAVNQSNETNIEGTTDYESQYIKIGFRKIPKPDEKMPVMPTNVSKLSYAELADEQAVFGAWREYAEDIVRALNVKTTLAQQAYDLIYAQKMITAKSSKVTEKRFMVEADPEVVEKYNELLHVQVEKDMYASKVESLTNSLAILSREITLRGNK